MQFCLSEDVQRVLGDPRKTVEAPISVELVRPAGPGTKPIEAAKLAGVESSGEKLKMGGGGPTDLHPFIQGLLKELPPAGYPWPESDRKLWLDTAASIFKMIYKDGLGPLPENYE